MSTIYPLLLKDNLVAFRFGEIINIATENTHVYIFVLDIGSQFLGIDSKRFDFFNFEKKKKSKLSSWMSTTFCLPISNEFSVGIIDFGHSNWGVISLLSVLSFPGNKARSIFACADLHVDGYLWWIIKVISPFLIGLFSSYLLSDTHTCSLNMCFAFLFSWHCLSGQFSKF